MEINGFELVLEGDGSKGAERALHRFFINGSEITLANKAYELLYFLVGHEEMVFSKEQLYEKI